MRNEGRQQGTQSTAVSVHLDPREPAADNQLAVVEQFFPVVEDGVRYFQFTFLFLFVLVWLFRLD